MMYPNEYEPFNQEGKNVRNYENPVNNNTYMDSHPSYTEDDVDVMNYYEERQRPPHHGPPQHGWHPGGPGPRPGGPGPMQPRPPRPPQGQPQAPMGPPPPFTPSEASGPMAKAIDPGAIRGCLYRNTYVWLNRRQSFWFFPVFVGRTSVSGYRWHRRRWIFFGIDLQQIRSFQCF